MINYLNKEKQNSLMKRISIMFLTFIILICSANATTYFDNQDAIINEINNLDLQSTIQPDILTGGSGGTNNVGYTISMTTTPIYLGFYTQTSNVSQIQIKYKLGIGENSQSKTLNLSPNVVTYIKFTSQGGNDYVNFQAIALTNGSQIAYSIFNVNDNGRGFSDVTNVMVGAMSDLISINIGFWKLIYYLFIFSIIIGGLGLLVNFAFKMYDWTDRVSSKKKEIFSGGHNKRGRD